jgi:hypothetical protein
VQPAAWVTVTVWLAMVTTPDRAAPCVGATAKVTEPSPLPLAAPLTVIHPTPLDALHAHDAPAPTVLLIVPPPAPTECVRGCTT